MLLKRPTIVCGAAVAALTMSITPGAAATGGHMWNESPSVSECLDTSFNPGLSAYTAVMWTCGSPTQQWQIAGTMHVTSAPKYTGYYIRNGTQCLDGYSRGASVIAYTCNPNDPNQVWLPVYAKTDGGYTYDEFQNQKTGECLSVAGGSTANGADVITWTCQKTPDQEWGGPAVPNNL